MEDPFGDSTTIVPLSDEFEGWVHEHADLGTCIQHPLYYSVPHNPALNDHANKMLQAKREGLDKARAEGKWNLWLVLHERPWRFEAFYEIEEHLSDPEYWELLGHCWIDSENIWQNEEEWLELLLVNRSDRQLIMEEDDRRELAELPATITIYRGFQVPGREQGISWTLDREKAEWFAQRWPGDDAPKLATGKVEKTEVIALINGRDERELIVKPGSVTITDIAEVTG